MQAVPLVAPSSFPPIFFPHLMLQAEVSLLWALVDCFPNLGNRDADHREAIEAQLCVLADELELSQVLIEFGTQDTDPYILGAAIQAAIWLRDGGDPPSTRWLRFASPKGPVHLS